VVGLLRGTDHIDVFATDVRPDQTGNGAFTLDIGGTFAIGEIRQTVSDGNLILEFNVDKDTAA
jgi:hypothetical protein